MADIELAALPPSWGRAAIVPVIAAQLTPSADVPACRDEDPAQAAVLAAAYPDPPEYQHPEDDHEGCISCGAEIDHHLGCPDDPNPDYQAEAELQERQS